MRSRRGRFNVFGSLVILVLLVAGGAALLFGPYYYDRMLVREATKTAALTYHETQIEERAQEELRIQFDFREIPDYIDYATMCTAEKGRAKGTFTATCAWTAYVYYPFTDYYKALDFTATSELSGGAVSTY